MKEGVFRMVRVTMHEQNARKSGITVQKTTPILHPTPYPTPYPTPEIVSKYRMFGARV